MSLRNLLKWCKENRVDFKARGYGRGLTFTMEQSFEPYRKVSQDLDPDLPASQVDEKIRLMMRQMRASEEEGQAQSG